MRFGILGPLDIRTDDGTPVDPGGPRPRALLTLLLLDAGRAVSGQRLTEGLYGAEPPAGAANALQSQVSRLRRRLAPHAGIEATATGYRIAVAPDTVDVHQVETGFAAGRTPRPPGSTSCGWPPSRTGSRRIWRSARVPGWWRRCGRCWPPIR
ncbi:winged helix-turn-helix domain-containing protein [Streptomyces sp. NPDC056660]|uniref:AfsR/SARP family transcriptional regulator n=1 Tax=Streptomyces sp. NPDC056660 TaxID=3345897 RepID=UPI00369DB258